MASVTFVLGMSMMITACWAMVIAAWWQPTALLWLVAVGATIDLGRNLPSAAQRLHLAWTNRARWVRPPSGVHRLWWGLYLGAIAAWVYEVSGLGTLPSPAPYVPAGAAGGWWFGITAMVLAFLLAARRGAPGWVLGLCALSVGVMIHATAPLLYDQARYTWTYKHFGVSDYIIQFGSVKPSIDAYHNWPGFFAWLATFTEGAGIARATTLARWWPLGIQAVTVAQLVFLLRSVWRQPSRRWAAVIVYLLGAWLGQDYLSPQSYGFMACTAIAAWCLRWLSTPDLRWGKVPLLDDVTRLADDRGAQRGAAALVLFVFAAVVVSHQLSPFMFLPFLIGAVWSCGLRPKWMVLVATAMVAAHTAWRWSVVSHHGGVGHVGDVSSNIQPPSVAKDFIEPSPMLKANLLAGLSVAAILTVLAGVGWLIVRRRKWPVTGIATMGVIAPAVSVLVQRYGGEGVLRAYLFALPWMAILVSSLLGRSLLPDGIPRIGAARLVVCTVAAGGIIAAFSTSFFGRDPVNAISTSEVAAEVWFETHAPAESTRLEPGFKAMPERITGRYNEFYWYNRGSLEFPPLRDDQGVYLPELDLKYINQSITDYDEGEWFLAFSAVGARASEAIGLMNGDELDQLEVAAVASGRWVLVFSQDDTRLYRFDWTAETT